MIKWLKNLFTTEEKPQEVAQVVLGEPSKKDYQAIKVVDYPRSEYSVYWEIIHDESREHGYKATLRLCSYMGGVVDEFVFVNRYKDDLQKQVYAAIPGKMSKYRKGL